MKDKLNVSVALLLGLLLLIGIIVRLTIIKPLTSDPIVLSLFADDAFYYLEIARNLVKFGVFTFDGINYTNGFHPLWQLLLSVLVLYSSDDFVFMQAVMYFSIVFFLITGVIIFKFVANCGGRIAGLVSVAIWTLSPDLIQWQMLGMENTIYLPLLILALLKIESFLKNPDSLKNSIWLGIIFSLLIWSRHDSIIFIILALIMTMAHLITESYPISTVRIRNLIVVCGFIFLSTVGYLIFNYYIAGSFLSVSGVLKIGDGVNSSWDFQTIVGALKFHLITILALFNDIGWLGNDRYIFQIFVLIWTIFLVLWWYSNFRKSARLLSAESMRMVLFSNPGLVLLVVYALIHTTILITLLRNILGWTGWYIVPQVSTFLVIVPIILFPRRLVELDLPRKIKQTFNNFFISEEQQIKYQTYGIFCSVIVIVLPCVLALFISVRKNFTEHVVKLTVLPNYELAAWLNNNVSPNAKVGMFDSGITGYFAHSHVVNLDGLVNSPQYALTTRRSGKYADYLIENKFEYIIMYYMTDTNKDKVSQQYQMFFAPVNDLNVCHRLRYISKNSLPWDSGKFSNFLEVIELRYDGICEDMWKRGFPLNPLSPPQDSNRADL